MSAAAAAAAAGNDAAQLTTEATRMITVTMTPRGRVAIVAR